LDSVSTPAGLNGNLYLVMARDHSGEYLVTDGAERYVSGTLLERWIRTFPKQDRRSIEIFWLPGGQVVAQRTADKARLVLSYVDGPSPRDKRRGPIPGTHKARLSAGRLRELWKKKLHKLKREALLIPT